MTTAEMREAWIKAEPQLKPPGSTLTDQPEDVGAGARASRALRTLLPRELLEFAGTQNGARQLWPSSSIAAEPPKASSAGSKRKARRRSRFR